MNLASIFLISVGSAILMFCILKIILSLAHFWERTIAVLVLLLLAILIIIAQDRFVLRRANLIYENRWYYMDNPSGYNSVVTNRQDWRNTFLIGYLFSSEWETMPLIKKRTPKRIRWDPMPS